MINEQALKARLQALAKEKEIPFNACWKQFLLERFLARIAQSSHADKLIFKGGFLLAYMLRIGRETVDLDFLLTRVKTEEKNLQEICKEIAAIPSEDGIVFSFANIAALTQPHMNYPGYRITLDAAFGKMRDKIHIDLGIGDIVEPQQRDIYLSQYRGKPFFENAVSLLVYPLETIFAEKLETVLSKGANNSRMKDYHDLLLLVRSKNLSQSQELMQAVTNTFENRGTTLAQIQFNPAGMQSLQNLWKSHFNGLGIIAKELCLPESIEELIDELNHEITSIYSLV